MSWRETLKEVAPQTEAPLNILTILKNDHGRAERANSEDSEDIEKGVSIRGSADALDSEDCENNEKGGSSTPAAFRCWLIDGREATYSPPASAEQLRRWHPTAELTPIPDDRRPPPEMTGADGVDRRAMAQAVRLALRGLAIDVEAVLSELGDDELSDWRSGHLSTDEIRAFAAAVTTRGTP